MLSKEEETEIRAELEHATTRQAAGIDALKVVRRHRGWVPDDSLQAVARLLDMTPAELDSVATFYNLIYRRPVGRHVILMCDTVSCWVMGYEEVVDRLRDLLGIGFGQTTADGRFTLLPVPCLGACDLAPVAMIDGELVGHLDTANLSEILDRYD